MHEHGYAAVYDGLGATYSNTPVSSGLVYRYAQFSMGLTKAF